MIEKTDLRKYIHTESNVDGPGGYNLFERVLPYEDRDLLVVQKGHKGPVGEEKWILVPGFIEEFKSGVETGLETSSVYLVPTELREDVTRFLQDQKLEGPVNYW